MWLAVHTGGLTRGGASQAAAVPKIVCVLVLTQMTFLTYLGLVTLMPYAPLVVDTAPGA